MPPTYIPKSSLNAARVVGATSGVTVKSTYGIRISNPGCLPYIEADNTILTGSTGIIDNFSSVTWKTIWDYAKRFVPYVKCQRLDRTDGNHITLYPHGSIKANAATYNTGPPSEEMVPSSASHKLESGRILIPANDGDAKTVTVHVRKNGTYNGNAPRLMMRRQDSIGVSADTVCATFSAAADTWQALTYTTAAALEDGAFEFFVDCDGTAGSVFADDVQAA